MSSLANQRFKEDGEVVSFQKSEIQPWAALPLKLKGGGVAVKMQFNFLPLPNHNGRLVRHCGLPSLKTIVLVNFQFNEWRGFKTCQIGVRGGGPGGVGISDKKGVNKRGGVRRD